MLPAVSESSGFMNLRSALFTVNSCSLSSMLTDGAAEAPGMQIQIPQVKKPGCREFQEISRSSRQWTRRERTKLNKTEPKRPCAGKPPTWRQEGLGQMAASRPCPRLAHSKLELADEDPSGCHPRPENALKMEVSFSLL